MFISYSVVSCPTILIQHFLLKISSLDHNRHYKDQVGDTAPFRARCWIVEELVQWSEFSVQGNIGIILILHRKYIPKLLRAVSPLHTSQESYCSCQFFLSVLQLYM